MELWMPEEKKVEIPTQPKRLITLMRKVLIETKPELEVMVPIIIKRKIQIAQQ